MVINDWNIYYFRLFAEILTDLENEVRELSIKHPDSFNEHPKTKLLASVFKSIFERVPANPNDPSFRLGHTLGASYASFRRVKKGLPNRYRLFFRFRTETNIIVYIWLNDDVTLRKAGGKTDVYNVFKKMLNSNVIPCSIDELLNQSHEPSKK